jgi:hypothetical protein
MRFAGTCKQKNKRCVVDGVVTGPAKAKLDTPSRSKMVWLATVPCGRTDVQLHAFITSAIQADDVSCVPGRFASRQDAGRTPETSMLEIELRFPDCPSPVTKLTELFWLLTSYSATNSK